MLNKLIKPLLVVALLFAIQIGGIGKAYAGASHQQEAKGQGADIKQTPPHDPLIAEASAQISVPSLQLSVPSAAFLTAQNNIHQEAGLRIYKRRPSSIPQSNFYKLILFPFHGFW
jgi:hypothetical protein